MNRRNILLGLALVLMVGLVAAIVARTLSGPPANRMLVAGDVRSVVRTITAPGISYPIYSYSVQVVSNAAPGTKALTTNVTVVSGPQASQTASTNAGSPVVAGVLSAVNVNVGDHVTTGTVLAQLDTQTLDLGVVGAKISAAKTKTTVTVLNNGIDTILDNVDKLETARGKLETGAAQLAAGKALLASTKASALAGRAQLLVLQEQLIAAKPQLPTLELKLAADLALAKTFPKGKVPKWLQKEIAGLQQTIGGVQFLLPTIPAKLAGIKIGLAKIAAAQAKLPAAEALLATGKAQLNTAADALDTAKTQAYKARDYVKILAGGANVGVVLAEAKRDQATIVSPVSGTVTQAPTVGTVACKGAPLVRIRPDDAALVDTYLTGDQLSAVHVGSVADVTFDSDGVHTMSGTVITISSDAEYPPTSFPTDVVHMTRTVKVTLRLDSGDQPPAGTPVDIAIHTN
jgi:hemolysin D